MESIINKYESNIDSINGFIKWSKRLLKKASSAFGRFRWYDELTRDKINNNNNNNNNGKINQENCIEEVMKEIERSIKENFENELREMSMINNIQDYIKNEDEDEVEEEGEEEI